MPQSGPQSVEIRKYDLGDRTLAFARSVRSFVKKLPRTMANLEDARQLLRSSGSVGANYIEACDALGKKDFAMRIRICRKEAEESIYWLKLIEVGANRHLLEEQQQLTREARELMLIFGAALRTIRSR